MRTYRETHGAPSKSHYLTKWKKAVGKKAKNKMIALRAYVNRGRWMVDCGECGNCPMVDTEARDAHCFECGAHWPVELPVQFDDINLALTVRPRSAQNWVPGETVDHLRRENVRHGVA